MNKVFEPGAVELADPRGDPSRAIEIQQKVEELLGANRQRQAGLRREILEQGAWALPGLINATYVWMNRLEGEQSQEMLADLMAQLAQDNAAAVDLLFRAGILETPFAVPRSIARCALEKLNWQPSEKNAQQIAHRISESKTLDDIQTVLDLYALLLGTGSEKGLAEALELCKNWIRRSLDQAGDLLALLTHFFPSHAERILVEVILAAKGAHEEAFKDENIAKALLDPIRSYSPAKSLPPIWLEEGVLLRVSVQVLREISPPRHTTVEYLWMYAVEDYKDKKPQSWQEILETVGKQVQQENHETVCRYWFRALDEVNEIAYLAQQARVRTETYGAMAALQLFFCRDKRAKQALGDLQKENPTRFARAEDLYDRLTSGSGKSRRGTKKGRGATVLVDSES